MRQALYIAVPLLTFALSVVAQPVVPSNAEAELIPDNQPFKVRVEELPLARPDRLVLNRSKAEFKIAVEQAKFSAVVPTTDGPTELSAAAAPSSGGPQLSGSVSLTQPGLTSGAPIAPGVPAVSAAVTPPAPVPQTMAQAAQTLPKRVIAVNPELAPDETSTPTTEAAPTRNYLERATDYGNLHRKEVLIGAAAVLLLLLLTWRFISRGSRDDADDE